MKKINKTRYAILGMLFDEPLTGYELRKRVLDSTAHFWQESDASIYPMLKKLKQEKKLTSHDESTGKRKRIVFEITNAGKKEFLAWLAKPVDEREHHRSEFLLKIFFGAHAHKNILLKLLKQQQLDLLAARKRFKEIGHIISHKNLATHPHQPFWNITVRFGLKRAASELEWVNESIQALK
jgi:DNA-binding PadR family transcriptional regulator